MKQLKADTICYYCLGCERLTNEQFDGVRNCKGFIPAMQNWQERLREELRKK